MAVPAVAVKKVRACPACSRSRTRLSLTSASVVQGRSSAVRILRSVSTETRCGRSAASVQSFAIPASRASSRTASSTWRLQEGKRCEGSKPAVLQRVRAACGFKQEPSGPLLERAGLRSEICRKRQNRIGELPLCDDRRRSDRLGLDGPRALQMRHDVLAAKDEQPAIELRPRHAALLIGIRPRSLECLAGIRIGDTLASPGVRKRREARKLAPPPFAHGVGEFAVMIGEELEWRLRRHLLAHEDERNLRTEQLQRDSGFERFRLDGICQPIAESAIADLIVVLQEQYESTRRQIRTRCAALLAIAMPGWLALVDEAFPQGARQSLSSTVGVVPIVPFVFSCEHDVQYVMRVVVPLRIEIAAQMLGDIAIVLQHEMNVTVPLHGSTYRGCHLVEPVGLSDRVHGVEAQPVEPIFH